MNNSKPIYKLGTATFSLSHDDPEFLAVLDRLFQQCNSQKVDRAQVVDLHMGLSHNIGECLREIISQHQGCLLIQAACMLAPNGHRVLISGAPNSGKTTLALALALQYGWKVIAEDMTIIDTETNGTICFTAPFNIKPGTRDALRDSGIEFPGFILREWYPLNKEIVGTDCQGGFDLSIHLDGEVTNEPMTISQTTPATQTRKFLPISNLLSVRGTEKILPLLPTQSCYVISGGILSERLQKIIELCTGTRQRETGKQCSPEAY